MRGIKLSRGYRNRRIEDSFPRRAHRVCTPSFSIITFHNHVFLVTFFHSIPEYPPLTRPGEPISSYQPTTINHGKMCRGNIPHLYIPYLYISLSITRSRFFTRRKRRASVVYVHTSEWFAATPARRTAFRIPVSSRFIRSGTLYARQSGDRIIGIEHF